MNQSLATETTFFSHRPFRLLFFVIVLLACVCVFLPAVEAQAGLGSVRFYPAVGHEDRMVGGQFQGSDDNSTWTTLYTVPSAPSDAWQQVVINFDPATFRYLRYLSPPQGYGNVAEIEFYTGTGTNAVKLTGTPFGTPGSYLNHGYVYTNALDGNTATFFNAPSPGNGDFVGIDHGYRRWSQYFSLTPGSNAVNCNIFADNLGNVSTTGLFNQNQLTSVTYDQSGSQLWKSAYSYGFVGAMGVGRAITADSSGYIYVTGQAGNAMSTIKYDSAGNQKWAANYTGPNGLGSNGIGDFANAIAVDKNENVYITGTSPGSNGSGSYDTVTIEYDSKGTQKWLARTPNTAGGNALAIDASGNIYVGASDGTLLKYNNGVQQWMSKAQGAIYYLVLDSSANVFVGGTVLAKFNTSGIFQWSITSQNTGGKGIGVDAGGNVYALSSGSLLTTKYSASGVVQWSYSYPNVSTTTPPLGIPISPSEIAVDTSGNVFVTGQNPSDSYTFVTLKYNTAGTQIWVDTFSDPYGLVPTSVAVDNIGDAFVSATAGTGSTNSGYLTIGYVH